MYYFQFEINQFLNQLDIKSASKNIYMILLNNHVGIWKKYQYTYDIMSTYSQSTQNTKNEQSMSYYDTDTDYSHENYEKRRSGIFSNCISNFLIQKLCVTQPLNSLKSKLISCLTIRPNPKSHTILLKVIRKIQQLISKIDVCCGFDQLNLHDFNKIKCLVYHQIIFNKLFQFFRTEKHRGKILQSWLELLSQEIQFVDSLIETIKQFNSLQKKFEIKYLDEEIKEITEEIRFADEKTELQRFNKEKIKDLLAQRKMLVQQQEMTERLGFIQKIYKCGIPQWDFIQQQYRQRKIMNQKLDKWIQLKAQQINLTAQRRNKQQNFNKRAQSVKNIRSNH